jgi:hypothetical protein
MVVLGETRAHHSAGPFLLVFRHFNLANNCRRHVNKAQLFAKQSAVGISGLDLTLQIPK